MKPKGIVLIAPPGAGKGTLADEFMLTKRFHHFSTRDYFRSLFKKQDLSELEKQVIEYMKNNLYVPDDVTLPLFKAEVERITKNSFNYDKDFFLLDGVPRTPGQIESVEEVVDVVSAIYINVGKNYEEIIKNVLPKLVNRARNESDKDTSKIIERIKQYFENGTHEVYLHYEKKGNLFMLNNNKSKAAYVMTVDRVVESILKTP